MKKQLLIILLSVFTMNAEAQCSFTGMVSGDSVTVGFSDTLSPFFDIDSVVFDFGDGITYTGVNTPPNSIFNFVTSHQYAVNGTYAVCMQEYTSWGGAPQPPCSHCDTIIIGTIDSCTAAASFVTNQSGLDVGFIDISTCIGCVTSTYFWNFGDGAVSTAPNPIHTYSTDGIYMVCLSLTAVSNSGIVCTNMSCAPVSVGSVGVNSLNRKHLNVYPNPVSNSVSVEVPEHAMNISFLLTDATGRTMWLGTSSDVKSGIVEIDMHTYSSGIYFLHLVTDQGIYDSKLIKE